MPKEEKSKKTPTSKKKPAKKKKPEEGPKIIPPLDFSSIVLPFYTQAVIKLGLANDPLTNKEETDLDLAKRLIDLLGLLQEKTKGGHKPEEEKFLDACLHQLRTAYMEKSNIINL